LVLHHEFFHVIDYRDDGEVYRDDAWAALNPRSFRYGSGGKNAQQRSDTSLLTDRLPGFLTHYSTTGVEEDKAELFAHLLASGPHVRERCERDAVLQAKVERMKKLLADFCPEMDEEFWAKAEHFDRKQD
jgi:hypothetical protein